MPKSKAGGGSRYPPPKKPVVILMTDRRRSGRDLVIRLLPKPYLDQETTQRRERAARFESPAKARRHLKEFGKDPRYCYTITTL